MVPTDVETPLTNPVDPESTDVDSLDELWSTCESVVEAVVQRHHVSGWGVDSADAVQHAALVVVEMARSGRISSELSPEALDALTRELTLEVREYLRSERRRLGRQVSTDDGRIERALARRAIRAPSTGTSGRALTRAIESLSPRQRAVIAGIYFGDSKVAALADELQVSSQAITALHRRALAAIRHKLKDTNLR